MTASTALAVAVGVMLLGLTAWDVVQTVFGVSRGGGPLTRRWMRFVSWFGRRARRHRRVLVWLGPVSAAATTPIWLGLLWLGWGLVFQPAGSVVATQGGRPVGDWEQAYFAGYTIATLGNGELEPAGAGWQALTVVTSSSGFIVLTLGVSYVLSLVSAANQRRTTAALINGLGRTPAGLLLGAWDGHDLHEIDADLRDLNRSLDQIAQQHLAYPVLRHFHATEPATALTVRLAALDEALTLLECAVLPRHRPRAIEQLRSAIDRFLGPERSGAGTTGCAPPPAPELTQLRAAGVPVIDDLAFRADVARLGQRRTALRRLVEHDGWTWADVAGEREVARDTTS